MVVDTIIPAVRRRPCDIAGILSHSFRCLRSDHSSVPRITMDTASMEAVRARMNSQISSITCKKDANIHKRLCEDRKSSMDQAYWQRESFIADASGLEQNKSQFQTL